MLMPAIDMQTGCGPGRATGQVTGDPAQGPAPMSAAVAPGALPRVLIVDDSRMQRRILAAQLARAGFSVAETGTADEAIDHCARTPPDIVISDWIMPGMTGLDLCRRLRQDDPDHVIYFILLTSKSEATDVAAGLDAGADDFLTKPITGDELRARIASGQRLLAIQAELRDKNRLLSETLTRLEAIHDSLDRDLREARKLQQSLVRDRHRRFGASEVSLLMEPAGHVGGDLVGVFPISARRVGLYAIDVSGHGITSALMTAQLAGYLSGTSLDLNIALTMGDDGNQAAISPAELAAKLNTIMLTEMESDSYFTMAYADADLESGEVTLVQAGHPHPAILRADGRVEFAGAGGLPLGLVAGASFESVRLRLCPGDRLILASDGFTEAVGPTGAMLGEDGFAAMLRACADRAGPDFVAGLHRALTDFAGSRLDDDLSAVVLRLGAA